MQREYSFAERVGHLTLFNYFLRLFVGIAAVAANDRPAYPAVLDFSLRGHLKYDREGQLVFVLTERAELVAELFRKHRHRSVNQIHGSSAFAGLLVYIASGTHVPGHVGYMHSHLEIAVFQLTEGQRIVKVLGIRRVNRKRQSLAEVLATLQFRRSNRLADAVSGILQRLVEAVREVEFGQNGVHLRVVGTGSSEHIRDYAVRTDLAPRPGVNLDSHLHTLFSTELPCLLRIDADVVRHRLALHQHPGLGTDEMQYAYERLV